MKRIIFSMLITTGSLFFTSNKASAQCNESGAYYDCYSFSNNSYCDSDTEVWSADGTLYWVNVNLQANHPTDAYAFAEISTSADYWSGIIAQGTYQDNFTVSGDLVGSLSLYTAARYGSAYIGASW
jgi:hypothetical protein